MTMTADQIKTMQRRFAATTSDGYRSYHIGRDDYDTLAETALTALGIIADRDRQIERLQASVEALTVERDFFQSEVKLRNRIPATNDTAANLQRTVERLQARLKAGPTVEMLAEWIGWPKGWRELRTLMTETANRMEEAANAE